MKKLCGKCSTPEQFFKEVMGGGKNLVEDQVCDICKKFGVVLVLEDKDGSPN